MAKMAGKTILHWVIAVVIGVLVSWWMGLFGYHGGLSVSITTTGALATLGVIFLSSIVLGILVKAIGK